MADILTTILCKDSFQNFILIVLHRVCVSLSLFVCESVCEREIERDNVNVCENVRVCAREREREREREKGRM